MPRHFNFKTIPRASASVLDECSAFMMIFELEGLKAGSKLEGSLGNSALEFLSPQLFVYGS